MKPINIFALTRVDSAADLKRFERQMSGRGNFITIKEWEVAGLKAVTNHLLEHFDRVGELCFYYSFQIPKLGKEFDLLRISEDSVINIELKSGNVSDERIKHQLEQNRYYLGVLGKNIRSYTYVSDCDRLVRLTSGDNLIEASWENLFEDMEKQRECISTDIEDLFKEEKYLISPLTDPDRFLRRDYFLTSQQRDIENKIIKKISESDMCFQGFSGLPGTGKTLLLYDIAMRLSLRQKVAVLHYGSFPDEMRRLDERLKRIDFFHCVDEELPDLTDYSVICVDEGHRITYGAIDKIREISQKDKMPVIFSYDREDAFSEQERPLDAVPGIESLPGFIKYSLTNRIRTNNELASFIKRMMRKEGDSRRKYPSVKLVFANDEFEAKAFLDDYLSNDYIYIRGNESLTELFLEKQIDSKIATCKEFERVVMVMNDCLFYDEKGYLRSDCKDHVSKVRELFHGCCRAKEGLALVVIKNKEVFSYLLEVVQGSERQE